MSRNTRILVLGIVLIWAGMFLFENLASPIGLVLGLGGVILAGLMALASDDQAEDRDRSMPISSPESRQATACTIAG